MSLKERYDNNKFSVHCCVPGMKQMKIGCSEKLLAVYQGGKSVVEYSADMKSNNTFVTLLWYNATSQIHQQRGLCKI
jgi:hypothetical protein